MTQSLGLYGAIVAVSLALHYAGRLLRVPAAALAVACGIALGRAGLDLVPVDRLQELLPAVLLHVGFLFGALGLALGRGFLRLSIPDLLRRSVRPTALATFALVVGAMVLPLLLPDLEPQRTYRRFLFPLACVFAAFPLLTIRDLRGRPGRDAGATSLVAATLVGAVYSFAPPLLWRAHLSPRVLWRDPILVLGESGAFGVLAGVLYLFVARRLRVPRLLSGTVLLAAAMVLSNRVVLWPPFAALGFGAVLGRAGERDLPVPGADRSGVYSEIPFLLLMGLAFAPDLWRESLVMPSLCHAAYLGAILVAVRWGTKEGRRLVTGPGLLFLGLALSVRLDKRMGPLMRTTIDFALPAWLILRAAWSGAEWASRLQARWRRGAGQRSATKSSSSEVAPSDPPAKSP